VGTAGFNNCKKAEKTRIPPTTANHRHFLGWTIGKIPQVLMVILPKGFRVDVLMGNGLVIYNYRNKRARYAKKRDFRQPPPTTAIF